MGKDYNIFNSLKKKVTHATFDMQIGGAEQVICNLIEKTDSAKYDSSILCIDQPIGPFGTQLNRKGFQVFALRRKPGFDSSLIRQIRHFIVSHDIDILHCHQYSPYVYGVLGAAFTRAKVIFTEHGRFYPDQRKLLRVLLNPFLALFTDYITAISSATKEALIDFENFSRAKIKVIYNGIDDSRYRLTQDSDLKQSLGISEDAHILGTVARLDSIKNQQMMIRALKIVREIYPETLLILVGDGPERANLEALVSEFHLTSNVIFTGFREDAHLFYKIMDIFLLTSFSEGTAMTLLEAMATGLPCIATDAGGNPEIVVDQITGFIVPKNNEKDLAEKIYFLLSNETLLKSLGNAGRKRFEENFTVQKMVDAYRQIYDCMG